MSSRSRRKRLMETLDQHPAFDTARRIEVQSDIRNYLRKKALADCRSIYRRDSAFDECRQAKTYRANESINACTSLKNRDKWNPSATAWCMFIESGMSVLPPSASYLPQVTTGARNLPSSNT